MNILQLHIFWSERLFLIHNDSISLPSIHPWLRMLGLHRGDLTTGSTAEMVLWARNDEEEDDMTISDNRPRFSARYVLVNGRVALAGGEVNPTRVGQFVELTRVKKIEDSAENEEERANQSPVSRSRDLRQPMRVEREVRDDPGERVKTAGISLDPAGVTSLDQVRHCDR